MATLVPFAISSIASRLLGVVALCFGAVVVRYSQRLGMGVANSIIRRPDIITDRDPPENGLRESATLFGRCIGAFLVLWGAASFVAGSAAVLGLGHWA